MLNEIRAEIDKLSALIAAAHDEIEPDQFRAASMAYEYLCIAICGRVEQDVKTILIEYARRSSGRKLERAIARVCRNFMNPEKEKIIDTLELFDRDYAVSLRRSWQDENTTGTIINEMVGHRKRIAHQTNSNRSMTKTQIDRYFKAYKDLVLELDRHFLSNRTS